MRLFTVFSFTPRIDLTPGHGVHHRLLALGALRVEAVSAPEAIAPGLIHAEVARDGEQPGLEARAMLPGLRALHDAQERLLRQILGSFAVAQHTQEEREQRGAMAPEERLEGPRVTLLVSGQ